MSTTLAGPGEPRTRLAVPSPRTGLRVGADGFRRLCLENPGLRLEREADGELILLPPASPDTGARNAALVARLWAWNDRAGLGVVFDSSAGFTFPNAAVRGPDASWMVRDRWDALPRLERSRFAQAVPDFVAEIRSRSDRLPDLRRKMRESVAQGVRLGWLIDPTTGRVEVHRPGRPREVPDRPGSLSGEGVLPGFVLELKGILFD